MPKGPQDLLRHIPAVEAVLQEGSLSGWLECAPRRVVVDGVRAAVAETRELILKSKCGGADEAKIRATVLGLADRNIRREMTPHYRKVINATGIILHTGLGRAVLPRTALDQICQELTGYSLLQASISTGARDKRDGRIEALLKQLTGCEAATIVNNNSAATSIVLNTVAKGREVIVSRGQLVEIGGSFRLPDVMEASGVKLVEVGTTNKTHARDYERAITENTAAIMRVHPSNYKILGFTSEVPLADLEKIAHSRGLVLIDDVGAGSLIDFSRFGFAYEPTLIDSVASGADVITASADKLIGGCQGGIVLGKEAIIEAVRKNPLARIVRVDKLTLTALEATLRLFLDEATALQEVPTLRMLGRPLADITAQAERIATAINAKAPTVTVHTVDGFSQMGSGSLPGQDIPTKLVTIRSDERRPDDIARRLRAGEPPVFARIQDDAVLLDPRTVLEGEEDSLVAAVSAALSEE